MILKLIDEKTDPHPGYGAGSGKVITIKYECPCGQGIITCEMYDIPKFINKKVHCDCKECNDKYGFTKRNAVLS